MRVWVLVACLLACGSVCAEPRRVPEIWACKDGDGETFDLLLWPDGTAVSTWVKGNDGAAGERGIWHRLGRNTLVLFVDGWTDRLSTDKSGETRHQGYQLGTPIDGEPTNEGPALRLKGTTADVVGVWIFQNASGAGSRYVTIRSDGKVFADGMAGTWVPAGKGIRCEWDDGAIDLLFPRGPQLRSWPPRVPTRSTPPVESRPLRVGSSELHLVP